MKMSIDRRGAIAVGLGGILAVRETLGHRTAIAAPETQEVGKWINWSWERVGGPDGKPGEMTPLAMVSAAENLVAATTGRVEFTDKSGRKAEWTDSQKENATYLVINEGQEGVSPLVPATYAWVGVTAKPEGVAKLTVGQMTEVFEERVAAIRRFQPNTRNLNVLWIKEGLIYSTQNYPVR